jgi:hypothetical protein
VRYSHILAEYLRIVQVINDSKAVSEHISGHDQLIGLKRCLTAMGWSDADIGNLIMDGDRHYLSIGIDRPMVGGVFLDWQPAEETAVPNG